MANNFLSQIVLAGQILLTQKNTEMAMAGFAGKTDTSVLCSIPCKR